MSEKATYIIEATATKGMLGTGGATSFVALLAQVDWLAVIGVLIALSGFYFSWRRNRREEVEHKLRMKKLQDEEDVKD